MDVLMLRFTYVFITEVSKGKICVNIVSRKNGSHSVSMRKPSAWGKIASNAIEPSGSMFSKLEDIATKYGAINPIQAVKTAKAYKPTPKKTINVSRETSPKPKTARKRVKKGNVSRETSQNPIRVSMAEIVTPYRGNRKLYDNETGFKSRHTLKGDKWVKPSKEWDLTRNRGAKTRNGSTRHYMGELPFNGKLPQIMSTVKSGTISHNDLLALKQLVENGARN